MKLTNHEKKNTNKENIIETNKTKQKKIKK